MNWHRIDFDDERVRRREGHYLARAFDALFLSLGQPEAMELWRVGHHDGGATYYFSPVAAQYARVLIRCHGGQPGGAPPQTAVAVRSGRSGALLGKPGRRLAAAAGMSR